MYYYNASIFFSFNKKLGGTLPSNHKYTFSQMYENIEQSPLFVIKQLRGTSTTIAYYLGMVFNANFTHKLKYTYENYNPTNVNMSYDFPYAKIPTEKEIKQYNPNNPWACNSVQSFSLQFMNLGQNITDYSFTSFYSTIPIFEYDRADADSCTKLQETLLKYAYDGDTSDAINQDFLKDSAVNFNVYLYDLNSPNALSITVIPEELNEGYTSEPYTIGASDYKDRTGVYTTLNNNERWQVTYARLQAELNNTREIKLEFGNDRSPQYTCELTLATEEEGGITYEITKNPSDNGKYFITVLTQPPPQTQDDNKNDYINTDEYFNISDQPTSLVSVHKMEEADLQALGEYLWTSDFFEVLIKNNVSPLDNIISVKGIPFDVAGTKELIKVGNASTGVSGARVDPYKIIGTVGTFVVPKMYDNFLDYEPYTACLLYLPYIGFVDISTDKIRDKEIVVRASIDLINGIIRYFVGTIGGNGKYTTFYIFDGSCGINISLSSTNGGEIEASLYQSLITGGIAEKGKAIVSSYLEPIRTVTKGVPSGGLMSVSPSNMFLVTIFPDSNPPSTYGRNIGYIWNISKRISEVRGWTICENPDLSGIDNLMQEEKDELYRTLTTGFYA